jgi:ribonuclease VapC
VKEYVLDTNALVRFFRGAPGFLQVRGIVQQARDGRSQLTMSVVNLGETLYVLARHFGSEQAMRCIQEAKKSMTVVPVDEQTALDAGKLRLHYKLGFADCFAAQLAMRSRATLVTADPDFARLGKQLKILSLPRHSQ